MRLKGRIIGGLWAGLWMYRVVRDLGDPEEWLFDKDGFAGPENTIALSWVHSLYAKYGTDEQVEDCVEAWHTGRFGGYESVWGVAS